MEAKPSLHEVIEECNGAKGRHLNLFEIEYDAMMEFDYKMP